MANSHSRFQHEDRVSLECFAALSAFPAVPAVGWWAVELCRAPSRAARAGVLIAAIEAGVTETELVPDVKRRRRLALPGIGTQHFKFREKGQPHGS